VQRCQLIRSQAETVGDSNCRLTDCDRLIVVPKPGQDRAQNMLTWAQALRCTAPTRRPASATAASRAAVVSATVSVRSGARNLSV
jgi:hypothetical protein